jgi:hypothetical protein
MSRFPVAVGLALVMMFSALPFNGISSAQENSLRAQLIGNWKPVSIVVTRPDGSKLSPFSDKLSGIMVLASDGTVALVNTRLDLPRLASGNRLTGTPEEYSTIMKGAHAFFGTFTVDEAAKTFTISITGSLYPNEIGAKSLRSVTSIDKDRLQFTYPGGGGATADAVWTRAK